MTFLVFLLAMSLLLHPNAEAIRAWYYRTYNYPSFSARFHHPCDDLEALEE